MQNLKKLELLAVDFKETIFSDQKNCAVCKAAKRNNINIQMVSTGRIYLNDRSELVFNRFYCFIDFSADAQTAAKHSFDNTVIRTITFI